MQRLYFRVYILRNFTSYVACCKFPTNVQKSTDPLLSPSFSLHSRALWNPSRSPTKVQQLRFSIQPRVPPSIQLQSRAGAIAILRRNVELHRLHKLWPSRFRNAPDFLYSLSAAHRLITERMPATVGCEFLGSLEQTIGIGWINGFAAGGWECAGTRDDENVTARFAFNYGFSVSLINIDTSVRPRHSLSRSLPRASLLISDVTRKRIENGRVPSLHFISRIIHYEPLCRTHEWRTEWRERRGGGGRNDVGPPWRKMMRFPPVIIKRPEEKSWRGSDFEIEAFCRRWASIRSSSMIFEPFGEVGFNAESEERSHNGRRVLW